MILDVDICLNTIYAWRIIGYILYIVRILVPLVLIIIGLKPFFSVIVKGTSDEIGKALKNLLIKIFIGILVFIIPSLINSLIIMLSNNDSSEGFEMCTTCMDSPSGGECESYISKYDKLNSEKVDVSDDVTIEGKIDEVDKVERDSSSTSSNGGNTSISSNGGNTSTSPSSDINGTKNIIIGDSRTVGMCGALSGSFNGCSYSGNVKIVNNDIYIAKGSMGYSWFISTAIGAVNGIISNNSNEVYNIFSLMGVNYLLSDIDSYINKYNSLASGEWKNHKIILVSVNPVDEATEASHGYKTKNSNIESFNNKLRSGVKGSNVTYCDVYNQIKNNFNTSDGLHYTSSTYKKIYELMMNCI